MEETCRLCGIDTATQKHHVLPKSKGGRHLETLPCCVDRGGQVHMLFNNIELAAMSLDDLTNHEKILKYLKWKKTHPGTQKHRMSNDVKRWRKGHR